MARSEGGLRIDVAARRTWMGDSEIDLTRIEFDVLRAIALRFGAVASHDEVIREVWRREAFCDTHTLEVHVSRIRAKLRRPGLPRAGVVSVRGVGYRIEGGIDVTDSGTRWLGALLVDRDGRVRWRTESIAVTGSDWVGHDVAFVLGRLPAPVRAVVRPIVHDGGVADGCVVEVGVGVGPGESGSGAFVAGAGPPRIPEHQGSGEGHRGGGGS